MKEAIDSILAQTYKNYEVILVNDGSNDPSTLEIIASLEGIVQVINQDNQGQGFARNRAIEHASGDFLAFLDSDDIWQPYALKCFYIAITQCNANLCFAEEFRFGSRKELNLTSETCSSLQLTYKRFHDFSSFYRVSSKNVYLPGAFCVRRSALGVSVRYLEERVNGEDLHFILQLTRLSQVSWITYPPILAYRKHSENSTNNYYQGALGVMALYRQRAENLYELPSHRSRVVSSILTSHSRAISLLMLRQKRIMEALRIYNVSILDNLSLLRIRYLIGFWLEMVVAFIRKP